MLALVAIALMVIGFTTIICGGRLDYGNDPDGIEAVITIGLGALVAFMGAVALWADMLWRIYA